VQWRESRHYIGSTRRDTRLKRIYRSRNSAKVFRLVFLALSLIFGVGAWRSLSSRLNTWIDFGIALILVLVGAGLAAQTLTARIVLSDKFIRIGSVFRGQSMRLDQIHHRHEYEEYQDSPDGGINVSYLELIPYDNAARSLKIPKDEFDFDRAFWDWMVSIPDVERLKP
jgi:hypothetical protein